MKYSFKQLLKMFFTGKPNPYTSKEGSVLAKTYKIYTINFPDGVVTTTNYFANIPDYTTWSEPMVELFLLIVKDWRNWERVEIENRLHDLNLKYTHKLTGVLFSGVRWVDELVGADGYIYKTPREYLKNDLLGDKDSSDVINLAKIWKQVHYGDKLARIEHIKELRSDRIRKEEEIKRAELDKIARAAEAQKIRDYLEGVSK